MSNINSKWERVGNKTSRYWHLLTSLQDPNVHGPYLKSLFPQPFSLFQGSGVPKCSVANYGPNWDWDWAWQKSIKLAIKIFSHNIFWWWCAAPYGEYSGNNAVSTTWLGLGLSLAKKHKTGHQDTFPQHILVMVRHSLWWVEWKQAGLEVPHSIFKKGLSAKKWWVETDMIGGDRHKSWGQT